MFFQEYMQTKKEKKKKGAYKASHVEDNVDSVRYISRSCREQRSAKVFLQISKQKLPKIKNLVLPRI